jgi:acyl carrier protein
MMIVWMTKSKLKQKNSVEGLNMDTQAILMDYIKQELMKGRNLPLNAEDDLFSAGIVDSLGVLQLVTFIEERFGFQVPDEDVVYENFYSVKALATYLEKQ